MMRGVDRECPIVIDIDDKITVLSEEYTKENIYKLILRTMNSLIGETSNCATAYHNKIPRTLEQRDKYREYVELLSVINGKAIDSAKTGIIFNIPRKIAKYSKPLPYFMKFASPYYATLTEFSLAKSNMNRLAKEIEKWEYSLRSKKNHPCFDYTIMIDDLIPMDIEKLNAIEVVFKEYNKEMSEIQKESRYFRDPVKYSNWFKENYPDLSMEEIRSFTFDWNYYYNKYAKMCREVCPDRKELANIAVYLCYVKYPSKPSKFMWKVAGEGILLNIRQHNIFLPKRDDNGILEYLGKRYSMMEVIDIDK